MVKTGGNLGFLHETRAEGLIGHQLAGQHFDHHVTLEARIVGVVDGRHTAAPKLSFDLVTAKILVGHSHTFLTITV